jgi:hypothetical protein
MMFDFAVQIERDRYRARKPPLVALFTRVSLQFLETDKNPGADIVRA